MYFRFQKYVFRYELEKENLLVKSMRKESKKLNLRYE